MNNDSPIHNNIEGMLRLVNEFPAIRLLGSYADWRVVGGRPSGEVRGIWESARLLATDSVAAWFELPRGEVVYGHVASFVEDEKDGDKAYAAPRVRTKAKSKAAILREELAMVD